jgi:hypothetical protein
MVAMERWSGVLVAAAAMSCVTRNDPDAAGSCSPNPAPSCGDGSIDAPEECEAGASCDACVSTAQETTLIGQHGLGPVVIATDGSSFAHVELDADRYLRRYSPEGVESWSTLLEADEFVSAAVIDATGNAYVAGIDGAPPYRPWLSSWDVGGALRWSTEAAENGSFYSCTSDATRLVAVGYRGDGDENAGLVQVRDLDGIEVWTMVEPSAQWIRGVAFVGAEIAVTAVGVERTPDLDDSKLMRYDEDGALRWSLDLPPDDAQSQAAYGVIADGMGGTWTFGRAGVGPYAVHHDGEGDELEVLDCVGAATGWVHAAALDRGDRLTLAIQMNLDEANETRAWFPTIEDGVVVQATSFRNDSELSAGPLAVQWRDDGALVLGWGRSGEEGGTYSELVALPP